MSQFSERNAAGSRLQIASQTKEVLPAAHGGIAIKGLESKIHPAVQVAALTCVTW